MRERRLSYMESFHCVGGACPDTCCRDWEIPVDPAAAAFYETLPGQLGEEVRKVLSQSEDGTPCLQLRGGKCPLLDGEGLCRVYKELGEERLSATCRSHPRFTREYGALREVGLCASCPECARLVLESDLCLVTRESPEPPAGEEPEGLEELLLARQTALAILGRKELPLSRRLTGVLYFANELQLLLEEEGGGEAVARLCQAYGELPDFPLPDLGCTPGTAMAEGLDQLEKLESLRPDWPNMLRRAGESLARGGLPPAPPEEEGARAAAYFIYRHWLRGAWDWDILTWAEFACFGTAMAAALAPALGWREAFRRFCLEIEHSEENMEALQDAFCALPEEVFFALAEGL